MYLTLSHIEYLPLAHCMQLQALLGEGHANLVAAKEAMLTSKHVAIVMEYAAGGNMTSYISKVQQHNAGDELLMSEDKARYLFRVRTKPSAGQSHLFRVGFLSINIPYTASKRAQFAVKPQVFRCKAHLAKEPHATPFYTSWVHQFIGRPIVDSAPGCVLVVCSSFAPPRY